MNSRTSDWLATCVPTSGSVAATWPFLIPFGNGVVNWSFVRNTGTGTSPAAVMIWLARFAASPITSGTGTNWPPDAGVAVGGSAAGAVGVGGPGVVAPRLIQMVTLAPTCTGELAAGSWRVTTPRGTSGFSSACTVTWKL